MARVRFRAFIRDSPGSLQLQHVLMSLLVFSWILLALLLAGCTTSTGAMANIFLLSIRYTHHSESNAQAASLFSNASAGGQVTVRAGYLGLCARTGEQGPWICASGPSGLGLNLAGSGGNLDPLNAIGWAARFKSDVVFSGLLFGAMGLSGLTFLGLATFPGWREVYDERLGEYIDNKPFPSRPIAQACLVLACVASLFLISSALWQHVAAACAASMIESGSQGYLSAHIGSAVAVLVWLALALVAIVPIGILVIILSIHLLDRLDDE